MDGPDTSAGTSKNEKINKGQLAIRNPLPPSLTISRSQQQREMSQRDFALVVYKCVVFWNIITNKDLIKDTPLF